MSSEFNWEEFWRQIGKERSDNELWYSDAVDELRAADMSGEERQRAVRRLNAERELRYRRIYRKIARVERQR